MVRSAPPTPSPTALDPLPTHPHPGPGGGFRKKELGTQRGRQEGCEGQREEVKDGERSEEGGRGSGDPQADRGPSPFGVKGVRSGGSSLRPATHRGLQARNSRWLGKKGRPEGRGGSGGSGEGTAGDRAGVALPRAAPSTAMETALSTRLARAPAACRLQLAVLLPPPSSLRASLLPHVPASRARPH